MVGAGNLIRLLFGLPYEAAVVIVGVVMLAYVLFGGMIATTWVQIVKAVLLLGGATLLARPGARAIRLQSAGALRAGGRRCTATSVLSPGASGDRSDRRDVARPGADARHGGPAAHPDAVLHRARRADGADVGRLRDGVHRLLLPADVHPRLRRDGDHRPRRDHRRSTPAATWRRRCWPKAVGGTPFLGFIAAVAFATILAVVAGLTLSGAATLSHDLWVNVVRGAHADRARAARGRARRDGAPGDRVDRARHHVQGTERRLHGGPGVRDCRQRELPGARAVDLLEPADDGRRADAA